MLDVILERFDEPDDAARFRKGTFETVNLGGMKIGRAATETIDPGSRR
jgi:hypothetical protein